MIGGNLGKAIKNFKTGVKEEEISENKENTEKIEGKKEEN
jgi:Sec-independent protein translocase protein TatA